MEGRAIAQGHAANTLVYWLSRSWTTVVHWPLPGQPLAHPPSTDSTWALCRTCVRGKRSSGQTAAAAPWPPDAAASCWGASQPTWRSAVHGGTVSATQGLSEPPARGTAQAVVTRKAPHDWHMVVAVWYELLPTRDHAAQALHGACTKPQRHTAHRPCILHYAYWGPAHLVDDQHGVSLDGHLTYSMSQGPLQANHTQQANRLNAVMQGLQDLSTAGPWWACSRAACGS
jgi:hypothetical protein